MRAKAIRKSRINLSLDEDLVDFLKGYARDNRTNAAGVITQFLLSLMRKSEEKTGSAVMTDPAFYEALDNVMARLQSGTEKMYSHEQVFGKPL